MTLYHGAPKEIEKIEKYHGVFDSFLFFSSDKDAANSHGDVVYSIALDENDILDRSQIFYQDFEENLLSDIISRVQEMFNCDEDDARCYLDESKEMDYEEFDGELSWDLQLLAAKCAQRLGYRGVAVKDEHGTSYMIDMLEREHELTRVK